MQKEYFHEAFGDAIQLLHVKSLEAFSCKEAFIVANEIFDAFACEVIKGEEMLFIEKNEALFKPMGPGENVRRRGRQRAVRCPGARR